MFERRSVWLLSPTNLADKKTKRNWIFKHFILIRIEREREVEKRNKRAKTRADPLASSAWSASIWWVQIVASTDCSNSWARCPSWSRTRCERWCGHRTRSHFGRPLWTTNRTPPTPSACSAACAWACWCAQASPTQLCLSSRPTRISLLRLSKTKQNKTIRTVLIKHSYNL